MGKIHKDKLHSEQRSGRCKMGHEILWDTMLACQPSMLTQRSMHHQKSSSDSPFHANTGTPETKHPPLMEDRRQENERPASWQLLH